METCFYTTFYINNQSIEIGQIPLKMRSPKGYQKIGSWKKFFQDNFFFETIFFDQIFFSIEMRFNSTTGTEFGVRASVFTTRFQGRNEIFHTLVDSVLEVGQRLLLKIQE